MEPIRPPEAASLANLTRQTSGVVSTDIGKATASIFGSSGIGDEEEEEEDESRPVVMLFLFEESAAVDIFFQSSTTLSFSFYLLQSCIYLYKNSKL